jgi:glycosyltransferase involved in cell wall biosynthesis
MPAEPVYSIIITAMNRPGYTKACIDSVLATVPETCEVIVVDNGSLSRTQRLLKYYSDAGKIHWIRNEENVGVAVAANQAVKAARGSEIIFLHNDCVVAPGWFDRIPACFAAMRDGTIKAATPLTNYSDEGSFIASEDLKAKFVAAKESNKTEPSADVVMSMIASTYAHLGGLEGYARQISSREGPDVEVCDEIGAFCILIHKDILLKAGGFDEAYRYRGYEERDLQLRLKLKGWSVGRAKLFVHHFGNVTRDGFGFNFEKMRDVNKPVYETMVRHYAGARGSSGSFKWTAVVFPDRCAELTRRLLENLATLDNPPAEVIEIPRPGIFPERSAWKWALPRVTTDFVAQLDSDMLLNKEAPDRILEKFAAPGVGCVASLLEDHIRGPIGYVKFWRTKVIKQVTFGTNEIRSIAVDVDYAEQAERLGWEFQRSGYIAGKHWIVLEPYNVFRAYFRIGIKIRARRLLGTPASLWGVEGAAKGDSPWAQIALLGFHCGIQADYLGDPHDDAYDEFCFSHYEKVREFCEALASRNSPAPVVRKQKIKIMLASGSFMVGGVERIMLNMALGLDKEKFETVIAYEVAGDVHLLAAAKRAGIDCYEVFANGGNQNPDKAWRSLLESTKPDVIVTFLRTRVYKPARELGIPMIERTPGWNGHSNQHKSMFDLVVCESSVFRDELLAKAEFGARPESTLVLYNGVDSAKFAPRDKAEARMSLGLRPEAFLIGAICRVNPVKNISLQIHGLKVLVENGVDAELHIVGRATQPIEEEEKRKLDAEAVSLGVSEKIFYHGCVDDPSGFMAAADVVALTSLTEGAPNALLEAMSMRKPIVATDVGAIREVTDGRAKYVATPVEYALAMIDLKGVGEVDYPRFHERHDMGSCIAAWARIIEEVFLKRNESLPYDDGRIRVALLCENLKMGGMEMFVKIFDSLVDKSKYNVFVYSHEGGPLESHLRCKVRLAPGPSWEFTDSKMMRWLWEDKIDVAIVITYGRTSFVMNGAKPCKVIERLDGSLVNLVKDRGLPDVVVFQSDSLLDGLKDKFTGRKQVMIYNGRDLSVFARNDGLRQEMRQSLGVKPDEVLVGCVGRLSKEKGHTYLVEAAAILRDIGVSFKLAIMGPDQGVKTELMDLIKSKNLESVVMLLEGSVDGPRALMSASDVYAQSSLREGLSGTLIEAAAAGLPIVMTAVGASAEIIGDNGTLVPPSDASALANALLPYITDQALREKTGRLSLEAAKKFSAVDMVRRYEGLIEDLAAEAKADADSMPLTTVVIPVYDRKVFLDKAIESVFRQTTPHWRLLVSFDTMEPDPELVKIVESFKDPRISWMRSPHLNHCSAMNRAVRNVKTPYTTRLDSDDMLAPDAIKIINDAITKNPDVGYFYTSRVTIDGDDQPMCLQGYSSPLFHAEEFSPARLEEWFIANHMVTWRNAEFALTGGFPEDLPFGEDYMFSLLMLLHGAKFMPVSEPLYLARYHQQPGVSKGYNANEQRFFIQTVRARYAKLKKAMGISWNGEDPGVIQPRRRISGGATAAVSSHSDLLDEAVSMKDYSRADRAAAFCRLVSKMDVVTPQAVSALAEVLIDKVVEGASPEDDLTMRAIDGLRRVLTVGRAALPAGKAEAIRACCLSMSNGTDRGAVAIAADMLDSGDAVGAMRSALGWERIADEQCRDTMLFTGVKAAMDVWPQPEDLVGKDEYFASTLMARLEAKGASRVISDGQQAMMVDAARALAYFKLRRSPLWSKGEEAPLSTKYTDVVEYR